MPAPAAISRRGQNPTALAARYPVSVVVRAVRKTVLMVAGGFCTAVAAAVATAVALATVLVNSGSPRSWPSFCRGTGHDCSSAAIDAVGCCSSRDVAAVSGAAVVAAGVAGSFSRSSTSFLVILAVCPAATRATAWRDAASARSGRPACSSTFTAHVWSRLVGAASASRATTGNSPATIACCHVSASQRAVSGRLSGGSVDWSRNASSVNTFLARLELRSAVEPVNFSSCPKKLSARCVGG
jgi:hypothetical protein